MSALVEEKLAFACRGCGATLRVPRRLAGVKGPCPKCGVENTAPEAPEPAPGPPDSVDKSAAAKSSVSERKHEPSRKPAPQTKKPAAERRRERKKKVMAEAPALPGLEPLMDEASGRSDEGAAEPASPPESAAPESAAPESAAPESAAPESAAPESAAPESAAPESAAPEKPARKRKRRKRKSPRSEEPKAAAADSPDPSRDEPTSVAEPATVAAMLEDAPASTTSPQPQSSREKTTTSRTATLPADELPEGVQVNESTGWIELPADAEEEAPAPQPLGSILPSEQTERVQRSATEPIGGTADRSPVAIPLDFSKLLQSPGGKSFVSARAVRRQLRRLNHIHPAVLAGGGSLVVLLLALLVLLPGKRDDAQPNAVSLAEAGRAFSEPAVTGPVAVEGDRDLPETNLAMLSPEPVYSRAHVPGDPGPQVSDPIAEDVIILPSRQELEEAVAAADEIHSGAETAAAAALKGKLSEPREVLERYFSLPTWQERLELTYRGEQLRDKLEAHYAEHADGAMPDGYQLEFFFVEESDRQGGPFYSYYLIEDNQSRPVPVVVRMTPEGPKVDWELFVEMRDRHLEDYLARPEERAPGDFRVILRRASYWGPERQKIARLEDYVSFSVNLPFADDLAYVLVKKDSALGRDLADEITWSAPPAACTVRLEWMNLEGGARALLVQEQLASGWHLDS